MRNADNANDDDNLPPGFVPLIGKPGRVRGVPLTGDSPIEALDLPVRTYNCLTRAGLRRVSDVAALTDGQLLALRNFGPACLADLRYHLRDVQL